MEWLQQWWYKIHHHITIAWQVYHQEYLRDSNVDWLGVMGNCMTGIQYLKQKVKSVIKIYKSYHQLLV